MLLSAKKDIYMINFSEKKTPLHSLNLVGGGGCPTWLYIYHPLLWKPTILGGMACN